MPGVEPACRGYGAHGLNHSTVGAARIGGKTAGPTDRAEPGLPGRGEAWPGGAASDWLWATTWWCRPVSRWPLGGTRGVGMGLFQWLPLRNFTRVCADIAGAPTEPQWNGVGSKIREWRAPWMYSSDGTAGAIWMSINIITFIKCLCLCYVKHMLSFVIL